MIALHMRRMTHQLLRLNVAVAIGIECLEEVLRRWVLRVEHELRIGEAAEQRKRERDYDWP